MRNIILSNQTIDPEKQSDSTEGEKLAIKIDRKKKGQEENGGALTLRVLDMRNIILWNQTTDPEKQRWCRNVRNVEGFETDRFVSGLRLVADELVSEFADPSNGASTPDQQQYDEKNIRRRVYDALNVLMAMDIISKDKKEIQWKGLARTSVSNIEDLKTERLGLRNKIEKKASYLQELEDQYIGLQKLIERNEQLYSSGNAPNEVYLYPSFWCSFVLEDLLFQT
ncbi:transcription factor-like protein DPB isoform X2 [Vigna angularis]|uniref:transcription factor-like protein DPB isoform X2 n=1 Tax=Phaseolus angularis TaxID=3914 RepID=UPI0022B48A51|nr:transcription factor-like protein DPB isoform X2 [Vigna angularis]